MRGSHQRPAPCLTAREQVSHPNISDFEEALDAKTTGVNGQKGMRNCQTQQPHFTTRTCFCWEGFFLLAHLCLLVTPDLQACHKGAARTYFFSPPINLKMFLVPLRCWLLIFVFLRDFEADCPSLNLVCFTVDLGIQLVSGTTETDSMKDWGE